MSGLQMTLAELTHAAEELRSVAEEMRTGMASLDDEVTAVVGGSWSGGASSAFGSVWREWHEGAAVVMAALTSMSALVDEAAAGYSSSDAAGADAIDGVGL